MMSEKSAAKISEYIKKLFDFTQDRNIENEKLDEVVFKLEETSKGLKSTVESVQEIIEGCKPFLQLQNENMDPEFAKLREHFKDSVLDRLEDNIEFASKNMEATFYEVRKSVEKVLEAENDALMLTVRKSGFHMDFLALALRNWNLNWHNLKEDEFQFFNALLLKYGRICVLCNLPNINKKIHRCRPAKSGFGTFMDRLEASSSPNATTTSDDGDDDGTMDAADEESFSSSSENDDDDDDDDDVSSSDNDYSVCTIKYKC